MVVVNNYLGINAIPGTKDIDKLFFRSAFMKARRPLAKRVSLLFLILILPAFILGRYYISEEPSTLNDVPQDTPQDMVALHQFIPGIEIDLKYATVDNFLGEVIYSDNTAYLRRGTAKKLKAVQQELSAYGYGLKIWDAYRPPAAQFKLWNKFPDARFVVNPNQGFSYHSRGIAVDVTLVNKAGQELLMPSEFDDFTARADRDYSDVSKESADNAKLLEKVMKKHGFDSIYYEWWHFIDNDREKYPVIEDKDFKSLPG